MATIVRPARNQSEIAAAYEAAARVFGPSYEQARAVKQLVLDSTDPIADPSEVIVAVDGSAVVGLVRLVSRTMRVGARQHAVAGVTSVAVSSSHRGQGLGLRLMRVAMRTASQRGDGFSVLFARRAVDGWYPKFGYVGVGQHVTLTPAPSEPTGRPAGPRVTVSNGVVESAMASYQDAYLSSYRDIPLSFVRKSGWWATLVPLLQLRPSLTFLTVRSARGTVAGYAVLEGSRVWEAALVRKHESLSAALVVELARRAGQPVTFSLHPSHWLMKDLYRANHSISVRRAWDGGHMLAALNPKASSQLKQSGLDLARVATGASDLGRLPVWTPLDEF